MRGVVTGLLVDEVSNDDQLVGCIDSDVIKVVWKDVELSEDWVSLESFDE